MAVTQNNFVGFETGSLTEEVSATGGSPVMDNTVKHSGGWSVKLPDSGGNTVRIDLFAEVADAGDGYIVGAIVRFADVTPSGAHQFLILQDTAGPAIFNLRMEGTSGDVQVRDANNGTMKTLTAPFTVNTFHRLEFYWTDSDTGAFEMFIDNNSVFSSASEDVSTGNSPNRFTLTSENNRGDIWLDSMYAKSGVTAASDRLDAGDGWEVFGFQTGHTTSTDIGSALDIGTWDDTGETPADETEDTNIVEYSTNNATGSTDFNDGSRPGPSGSGDIDGDSNIKAAKFIWRLRRTGGAANAMHYLYGNSGDGTTQGPDINGDLTTSYKTFTEISVAAAIMPLSTEVARMGMDKAANTQDIRCAEMWCMVLHVPAAAGGPTGVSVVATATGVVFINRDIFKTFAVTAGGTSVLHSTVFKTLAGSAVGVAVLGVTHTVAQAIVAAVTGVVDLTRLPFLGLSAPVSVVTSLGRNIFKGLSATATGAVDLGRLVFKTLAATATGIVTLDPVRLATVALQAVVTSVVTLVKMPIIGISVTATSVVDLGKIVFKLIRATATGVTGLTVTFISGGVNVFFESVVATATAVTVLNKTAFKTLTATATGVVDIGRLVFKGLAATAIAVTVLDTIRLTLVALAATVTVVINLAKMPVKMLEATVEATLVLGRFISTSIAATATGTIRLGRTVFKTLSATATVVLTLANIIPVGLFFISLTATASAVVSLTSLYIQFIAPFTGGSGLGILDKTQTRWKRRQATWRARR